MEPLKFDPAENMHLEGVFDGVDTTQFGVERTSANTLDIYASGLDGCTFVTLKRDEALSLARWIDAQFGEG